MVPRAPSSAMVPRAPSSTMAFRAPCTTMASRVPSSAMVPVCLFCSGGPRPAFLSVSALMELLSFGRGELCQSSVVCVMCPHLMFPYLVGFLSLFNVIISSFMSSRVCLIIYDLPVYISSCLFSLMSSGLLVIPGVSCLWVLPCPAMSCLDVLLNIIIWVYILVCVFLFLPRVCTVTKLSSEKFKWYFIFILPLYNAY